jgi:hypothetical protein
LDKKLIKLRFQNGLTFETFKKEAFDVAGLNSFYRFEESDNPDFIIFGPYGDEVPEKGNYIRIGYFCENMVPELSICEWAFGVMPEETINNPKYSRIQWHDLNPQILVKGNDYNAENIFEQKKYFCNFLYSNIVPYREEFFRQLSKYKKVDAAGKSMNNMASIDHLYKGDIWERKRQYLSPYKFTIAFENYIYPGYQTEKLYDAMRTNSIPIYCGDPFIGKTFNTKSFVHVRDYINTNRSPVVSWLEKQSQQDYIDTLPHIHFDPYHRVKRKLKIIGREIKMKLEFQKLDFSPVIERIIELDSDNEKYLQLLKQPWFTENMVPPNLSLTNRWRQIFG